MVEYNKINVKSLDSQLNRLKSAVKNQAAATLRMNMKMLNENNLPQELLLTTREKNNLRNRFEKNMSTDIKLSRARSSKIIQSVGFLGLSLSKLTGPLIKVAVPLAKKILASLGITAAASAINARTRKKMQGSGATLQ